MGRGSDPRAVLIYGMGKALQRVPFGKYVVTKRGGGGGGLVPTDRPWLGIQAGARAGRRLTCVGRSIVAADIRGLMSVGWHHLIVVLVRAVDAHLGSPAWSAASDLGRASVPYPSHLVHTLLGPQHRLAKFRNGSPDTGKLLKKSPTSPQDCS